NLQVTGVSDRLRNVEQHKVVEKHVGVGGERRRGPILSPVLRIPGGQAVFQTLKKKRSNLISNGKWRLLVPQVTHIVYALQTRIVEADIGLLGATNPIEARGLLSDQGASAGQRHRLCDGGKQRTLVWIEHPPRIELDDNAQHIVVQQQVLKGFEE